MKCARCLWSFHSKPVHVQERLMAKRGERAIREAITIYHGNALCVHHLDEARAERVEEGKDPWR